MLALLVALRASLVLDVMPNAERMDEPLAELVSIIAHQLRNPIATIRGFGQLLRDRPETFDDERTQQAYDVIVRQADLMAAIIDGVVELARIESGTMSYTRAPFDPRALIHEAVDETRTAWPSHEIVIDATDEFPTATGDAERIRRVFLNLLSNACRFSSDGTRVDVRAHAGGAIWRVDVTDRGPGIDGERTSLVFDRFTRGRTPDARNVRGSGLGLYLSARIAEAHGGRIWLESEPGRGSTFSVELPFDARPA